MRAPSLTHPRRNLLYSAPVNGGAPVTLVSGQAVPFAIAADTSNLYWTNLGCGDCGDTGAPSGSVMEAELDGSNPFTVASMQDYPTGIAAAAPNVYWATHDGNVTTGVSAAGMTMLTTVASAPLGCAFGLAVCNGTLFWTDTCDGVVYSVDTTMPNGLSPGMFVGNTPAGASPFAVGCSGSSIPFWANAGGSGMSGGIFAYSSGSGDGDGTPISQQFQTQASVPFGPGSVYPDAIVAVDNANVYWADTAAGTVVEAPMIGGKQTTLASGQDHPFSIGLYPPGALTATRVYWVNRGSGTGSVMGVAL